MYWRMAWLAVSLLMVVGSLKLPQADARIVVGVSTVNVAFLPIYLTQDKGFFKDEGLDVLVVMFNAGATNLQALSAVTCRSWPAVCRKPCSPGRAAWTSKISGRFPISCRFRFMAIPP